MTDVHRALIFTIILLVTGCEDEGLAPVSGAPEYQRPNFIPVFANGSVNAANGNLLLERSIISIDTSLGTQEVSAAYNSASGWLWNFQTSYADGVFTDSSGREHDVAALANGEPIAGTVWKKVDADTIATKGGLAHHFRADGSLDHIRWATLDYPRVRHLPTPLGVDIQQCSAFAVCETFYQVALNADGRPIRVTGTRMNRTAELAYDNLGRLESIRTPFEVEEGMLGERFEYAGDHNRITAVSNSEGDRTEVRYRSAAPFRVREVLMLGEGEPHHSFRYSRDAALYVTTYTNPLGGVTELRFDATQRLHQRCRTGLALCSSLTWQGRRPSTQTTESGVTTAFEFVDDVMTMRVEASGNVVVLEYQPGGLNLLDQFTPAPRRISDSIGMVEERSYDPQGRPDSIRLGDEINFFTYTGSRVRSITPPGFPAREFTVRGAHGHWLEVEIAGVGADSRLYDPVGEPVVDSARIGEGGFLARSYNGNRQLASVQMAASNATGLVSTIETLNLAQRSDNQPLRVERPNGNDHEFVYDALGRATARREQVDGLWHDVSMTYDLAGALTSRTLPNGMRQELDYDAYGRLEETRSLRDGVLEGYRSFAYAAGTGLLESEFDSKRNASTQIHYDPATGSESYRQYGSGEIALVQRDARLRVTRRTFISPWASVILDLLVGYDLSDRVTRITDNQTGDVLLSGTFASGLLMQQSYGNGLVRSYFYDDLGRLEGMETLDATGALIASTTLDRSFESSPNRQQIVNTVTTPLASTSEEFWLPIGDSMIDPSAFVGKRVFHWSNGTDSEDYAWGHDNNLVGPTYNGDGSRLLSASGIDYLYDDAGYVIERDGVAIEWDANGFVSEAGDYAFEWDMRGVPIAISLSGVPLKQFRLFDGALESTTSGVVAFSWGPLRIDLAAGERRYTHYDFRSNVSFVSDDAGNIVEHRSYRPFGIDQGFGSALAGGSFARSFQFGSLLLMGVRVYDPLVGRFLSQDPVSQLTNQYTYAQGNPVDFMDSSGAFTISANSVKSILVAGATTAVAVTAVASGVSLGVAIATGVLVSVAVAAALDSVAGDAGFSSAGGAVAAGMVGLADAVGAVISGPGSTRTAPPQPPPPPSGPTLSFEIAPDVPAFGIGCSPAQLTNLPSGQIWLPYLVTINLVLGLAVLHRRRRI